MDPARCQSCLLRTKELQPGIINRGLARSGIGVGFGRVYLIATWIGRYDHGRLGGRLGLDLGLGLAGASRHQNRPCGKDDKEMKLHDFGRHNLRRPI